MHFFLFFNKNCSFAIIILQLDWVGGRVMGGVGIFFSFVHCAHFGLAVFFWKSYLDTRSVPEVLQCCVTVHKAFLQQGIRPPSFYCLDLQAISKTFPWTTAEFTVQRRERWHVTPGLGGRSWRMLIVAHSLIPWVGTSGASWEESNM